MPDFCSSSDIDRKLSAAGVAAFADNDGNGSADAGVVQDCIDQATGEISDLASQWYTVAALASNTTVNRWATIMACVFLCETRGNDVPESLLAEFQRITAYPTGLLWLLSLGKYKLSGVPLRADMRPAMSNVQIDRRYTHSKTRVTRYNSTDSPTVLSQHLANQVVTNRAE